MNYSFRKLFRRQVQKRLDPYAGLINDRAPKEGWIKIIREALGLSSYALAKKVGCSQPNIISFEKGEKEGSISLNSLEKVASALDCKLVYCLVPLKPLEKMLEDEARKIALDEIKSINHSMALENQKLSKEQLSYQVEDMIDELLHRNPRYIWNYYDKKTH